MFRVRLFGVLAIAAAALTGCKRDGDSNDEPAVRPPEQIGAPAIGSAANIDDAGPGTEAERYFRTRCANCHGPTGRGDGPALAIYKLKHKPQDYTKVEWQQSISDDEIKNTILYGGSGVGKSPDMPSFGDLQGKSELQDQLVQVIRALANPPPPAP